MAYIGRDTDKISNVEVLDNITFDGSSSYTLQKNSVNFTPSSANTLLLSIDGVVQAGNFTVSGSTIDFGTAVAGTSTCDFILHYGVGLITTPSDGTVTTAKLADSSVTAAKITDSTITAAKLASGTVQNQSAFKNIIINGDMSIAQRGTSVSSISSGATYNTIDRFRFGVNGLGTWTQSQSTDVPSGQGFAKSFKLDCTATGTLSASDYLFINYNIEGQHVQYLKKGTSNAESLTLSFWVKSNKTGIYTLELDDNDNNRSISKTFTIDSASTWEKKTITFEGDTTGTLDNDNNNSLRFYFWLGSGSDNTSGTLQTSWGSTNNPDRVSSSNVNLADSTSNEFYLTGVQLEAGTSASDFEFLPVDINLQRCQRYFERTTAVGASDNYVNFASGVVQGSSYSTYCFLWKTKKRANPTMSSTAASTFLNENGGSFPAGTTINFSQINKTSVQIDLNSSSGLTVGNGAILKSNGTYNAYIDASSEL